jgi:hypothetical protein
MYEHEYSMMMVNYVLSNGCMAESEKILERAKTKEMIELLIKNGANVSNSKEVSKSVYQKIQFLVQSFYI